MDSKGGRLDNGNGQLTENSVNCTINEVDTLSKRLGFIRGASERFGTVVCGLHSYVDNCGVEWLLVASDEGIAIRQPYAIPVFETDDSYPNDAFDAETGLSTEDWRNTDLYAANGSVLLRTSGDSTAPFDRESYLRWFKEAASSSYEVSIQYQLDADQNSVCSVVIRGTGDLTSGRMIQADISLSPSDGAYFARLYKTNLLGERVQLAEIAVAGSLADPSGFLTLRFERSFDGPLPTRAATITVSPTGGSAQAAESTDFNELEDSEMGRVSGIGCSTLASILQVTGEGV